MTNHEWELLRTLALRVQAIDGDEKMELEALLIACDLEWNEQEKAEQALIEQLRVCPALACPVRKPAIEPDPAYLGTEKWREHKSPSEDAMLQLAMRTREAWRDYLFSGRVRGQRTVRYAGAEISVRVERDPYTGDTQPPPAGSLPGFWDPMPDPTDG